jgi:hypothetical protein
MGDDAVMIIMLEDRQKLAEGGQVASRVFLSEKAGEGLISQDFVEVIGQALVERFSWQ